MELECSDNGWASSRANKTTRRKGRGSLEKGRGLIIITEFQTGGLLGGKLMERGAY